MARIVDGFCDGCDCVDSNQWGVYCQILGNGCIREGHPDICSTNHKYKEKRISEDVYLEYKNDGYDELRRQYNKILDEALNKIDALPIKTTSKWVENKNCPEHFIEVKTGEYVNKQLVMDIIKQTEESLK